MPTTKKTARSAPPTRLQLRQSRRGMEIVIEGTVPVLVVGLLALVYLGHLLY